MIFVIWGDFHPGTKTFPFKYFYVHVYVKLCFDFEK